MSLTWTQILITLVLAIPLVYVYKLSEEASKDDDREKDDDKPDNDNDTEMATNLVPNTNSLAPLPPPRDDPFTQDQLKEFDGTDSSKPIYISIKGMYSLGSCCSD